MIEKFHKSQRFAQVLTKVKPISFPLCFVDISLPKSSRRETKVPLKYRMDGDYSADGKLYSSLHIGSQATTNKQDQTENNLEAASDSR